MNKAHMEGCSSAEWADVVRRFIIPWVLDGLDLGPDVLEIGPGPGRTTEVLVEMVEHLSAVELDEGLALSLTDRLPGCRVLQGDATSLDLTDASFTSVLSLSMLHHLPSEAHQDRAFAEAARVLVPGGVLAGTDSLDSPEFRDLHVDDTCVPIDPETLGGRLERAGFERVEVDTNEYATRFRGWLPNR